MHALAAGQSSGMRLAAIADASCLDRATTMRLLDALCNQMIVRKNSSGKTYTLGPELVFLGRAAERSFSFTDAFHRPLLQLVAHTGDCGYVMIRSGASSVCLCTEAGDYPVQAQVVKIGTRRPLGVGGTSLALLAALPDEEITDILMKIEPQLGNYAGYSVARLRKEIRETRERGYALIRGYQIEDILTLSCAIRDPQGQYIAAISVATISSRLSNGRENSVAELVSSAAREIEERLRKL